MKFFKLIPIKETTKKSLIILLSIVLSLLSAVLYLLFDQFPSSTITILGFSFVTFSLFWAYLFLINTILLNKIYSWMVIIFVTLFSIGIPFLFEQISLLDFVLFIGLGIGISLIIAGIIWKLIALIIAGALLSGIAPGLYFGWENSNAINPLEQTGIMLVGFAFGWGFITVLSRALTKKFVWWPLIPGGILAVVGWGLYIAGNPESAVGFIGNTGSVGLIIFGIYILLMRKSFHQ
jgi:hypothetical protein